MQAVIPDGTPRDVALTRTLFDNIINHHLMYKCYAKCDPYKHGRYTHYKHKCYVKCDLYKHEG